MKIKQIGDWTLEDRLAARGPAVVVLFLKSDGRRSLPLRAEFRRVAANHPDANFYEVDLIENPSLIRKYSLSTHPVVLVFVDGAEVGRHGGTAIGAAILRILGPCPQEGDES